MNCTASSYFIPLSMRAKATKTGALRGDGSGGQEGERRGGGKDRRLKVRVHTETKSYAGGEREVEGGA